MARVPRLGGAALTAPLLLLGDCAEKMASLPAESVDAVVTDPPYGLEFMGKDWDRPWAVNAEQAVGYSGRDDLTLPSHRDGRNANCRRCGGRARGANRCGCAEPLWDRHPSEDMLAFQRWTEEWAAEAFRVLRPGGHLLAFGGTRTYHRLAAGVEDAGFEVRDTVAWMYGCLTPDVEVLTASGWKRGIDVEVGERVAQFDSGTEAITLAPVERTYRAAYSGPMRVLRNHDTDQLLTPNHRVVHEQQRREMTAGVLRSWWENGWTIGEAADVPRSGRVRFPLAGYADGPGVEGGEDYAALLGWVWTEGSIDRAGSGVRVYQSPSANPEKVEQIDALMHRIVPGHKRYDRERDYDSRRQGVGTVRVSEAAWFFTGDLARRVRADLPGKRPALDVLWRMTLAERRAFLDAALLGDGSQDRRTGSWQFYAKHRADLDVFQVALTLTGQRGRVTMRPDREAGAVSVTPRPTTELQTAKLRRPDEHYDGDVWCIGVPTGAFIARRGGQVFVTGNSGFPKSLDVSKAIDKLDARDEQTARARAFQRWAVSAGLTPKIVDGLTGTVMGAHLTTHPTQPSVPTERIFAPIREYVGAGNVPAEIEGLVADRTVESENFKRREVVGERVAVDMSKARGGFAGETYSGDGAGAIRVIQDTTPATDDARAWEGWGTALKPAFEPIVVARKPLVGTVAANVLAHGTGALNIDGCRIATTDMLGGGAETATTRGQKGNEGWERPWMDDEQAREAHAARVRENVSRAESLGRWPANVVLDEAWEPILCLTYNLSDDAWLVLSEWCRARNGDVPAVRGRDRRPSEPSESPEILLASLSASLDEREPEGGGAPDVRSQPSAGLHRANAKGEAGSSDARNGQPELEGLLHESRVRDDKSTWRAGDPGTPLSDGTSARANVEPRRSRPSHQRCEVGQQTREPRTARRSDSQVDTCPALSGTARASRARVEVLLRGVPANWLRFFEFTGDVARIGAAAMLDEQTGDLVSGANPIRRGADSERSTYGSFGGQEDANPKRGKDTGGASRFFYCAKTSRAERNAGLGPEFEPAPLNWLSGEANPGSFQGEGTEREAQNHHPTVKPVALMRWLIRLVTPPGGLVLDPFLGSGTTGCAAALEGVRFVGIERDPGYMEIARARIGFWTEHGEEALAVVAEREQGDRLRAEAADAGQASLFDLDVSA